MTLITRMTEMTGVAGMTRITGTEMVTLVTGGKGVGGWDKVNDTMTGIHRMIGMPGIPGDSDGKGDYDEPAISRITGLTGMTGLTEMTTTRLIPC